MSAGIANALGGEHATARRGSLDAYEREFIVQKFGSGVSIQNVAHMIGRPMADVSAFIASITPPPPEPPPERLPVVRRPESARPVPPTPPHLRRIMDAIIRQVAAEYGVPIDDLMARGPAKRAAHPRQHAMWAIYETGKASTLQIGAYLGRDHSTVLHGIKAHQDRLDALQNTQEAA